MTKLTHREHTARAILMGRVYDWRDGTYCEGVLNNGGVSHHNIICAVTFEPITNSSITRRMFLNNATAAMDWRKPRHETPWARMDDD